MIVFKILSRINIHIDLDTALLSNYNNLISKQCQIYIDLTFPKKQNIH